MSGDDNRRITKSMQSIPQFSQIPRTLAVNRLPTRRYNNQQEIPVIPPRNLQQELGEEEEEVEQQQPEV